MIDAIIDVEQVGQSPDAGTTVYSNLLPLCTMSFVCWHINDIGLCCSTADVQPKLWIHQEPTAKNASNIVDALHRAGRMVG
jgi:hypothetical protein